MIQELSQISKTVYDYETVPGGFNVWPTETHPEDEPLFITDQNLYEYLKQKGICGYVECSMGFSNEQCSEITKEIYVDIEDLDSSDLEIYLKAYLHDTLTAA